MSIIDEALSAGATVSTGRLSEVSPEPGTTAP